MQRKSIRVAFTAPGFSRWRGGVSYLRNLLHALAANRESRLECVLFAGVDLDDSFLDGFPPVSVARSRMLDRPSPAWLLRAASRRALPGDLLFERVLRANGIDALSHSSQLSRSSTIAMLGWIPDFQHTRLPEFFTPRERRQRDRTFARICDRSTLLIVSSECSWRDLAAFQPEAAARCRVLRFVAQLPSDEQLPTRTELVSRYGVEGDYFLVANQFWVHKNHGLLLEALRLLRDRGRRVLVVAPGDIHDYREPGYFDSLVRRANALGVSGLFRSLGVVPNSHVAALMRDAVAVINPSRFEGWSTPVEEAKSLGKRILLSDIDVHREQDPAGGAFFDPDDTVGLADAMSLLLTERDATADERLARQAGAALPDRTVEFANTYESIVVEALGIRDGYDYRDATT